MGVGNVPERDRKDDRELLKQVGFGMQKEIGLVLLFPGHTGEGGVAMVPVVMTG